MVVSDAAVVWILGWILIYIVFWQKNEQGENLWYIAPWINIFYAAAGYQIIGTNTFVIDIIMFICIYHMIRSYTVNRKLTDSEDYTG